MGVRIWLATLPPGPSVKTAKIHKSAYLVSLGRESQKSLSHCANPVSHAPGETARNNVSLTVLGLSPQRPEPEDTFRTLLKPRGPNDQKNMISIEIFNLDFDLDVSIFPTKK